MIRTDVAAETLSRPNYEGEDFADVLADVNRIAWNRFPVTADQRARLIERIRPFVEKDASNDGRIRQLLILIDKMPRP